MRVHLVSMLAIGGSRRSVEYILLYKTSGTAVWLAINLVVTKIWIQAGYSSKTVEPGLREDEN